MSVGWLRGVGVVVAAALAFASASGCRKASPPEVRVMTTAEAAERGKELVSLGGCNHCHTPMYPDAKTGAPAPDMAKRLSGHPSSAGDPEGAPGARDQAVIGATFTSFRAPFGVVYAANLTPDDETGLGRWSESDFIATMRTGHRKGTERLMLPPMPWQNLALLSDADLHAMYTYLRTLPPIHNAVPSPKVPPAVLTAMEESARLTTSAEH